ncbi:MAG TPA: acetyl-CoA carboxylase carboxyltransferase subunit alpha [Chloroflexia bacterium]|nr:acetyl-CoA carboxylase carboxyltransferase subunit alpha [Chloroflexia bacterium]
MATEHKPGTETTDTNHRSNGPAGPYREMVPPGISHSDGQGGLHSAQPTAGLSAWERVQIARHPERPHTLDYIQKLCPDFVEMHGDRLFGDDAAIVGGLGQFGGQTVMIIGQQKGRSTKENIARNFGMPQPEGYRKAQRLMEHAARFGFPILTFIDTPGASPGLQSEERGIGQAIAASIMLMLTVEVPIIATVIGEGGSGGALAIGVADRVLMLENSIYSVASPEAAAAILWRDAGQASTAAETMRITAPDLLAMDVIDGVIPEPEGGAHEDLIAAVEAVGEVLLRQLEEIKATYSLKTKKGTRQLLEDRRKKYRRMGSYAEGS